MDQQEEVQLRGHHRGWERTKPQKQPLSSLRRGVVFSIHRAGASDRPDLESGSLAGSALWLEASCYLL